MGETKTAGRGRPRTHEPGKLEISEKERALAERVMRYAQEFNTSFEKAFTQVALGRPDAADTLKTALTDLNQQARLGKEQKASPPPSSKAIEMLSLGAAAREAHVAKATLGRWLEAGEIEGVKVQGVWQIHPDQLERMAEIKTRAKRGGHRQKAAPDTDKTTALISALERLVEAEQLRADAAEYRYDQMIAAFLKGAKDV